MDCLIVGHQRLGPDWHVTEPSPPGFSRVYFFWAGTVWYEAEGRTVSLEQGTLYVFPSAAPFCIRHDPLDPIGCTWLHADFSPVAVSSLIALPSHAHPFAAAWAELLRLCAESRLSAEMGGLLVEQLAQYCREKKLFPDTPGRFRPVMEYLEAHYAEPVSVADMSRLVVYNQQYFIRAFREEYGLSPHRYLTLYRLRKAVRLLRQGTAVGEAARLTGYPDTKSFSRAFRKEFGLCPSQFQSAPTLLP